MTWNKNKPTVSGWYLAKNSKGHENKYRFDADKGCWFTGTRGTTLVHNIIEWKDEA